MSQEGLQTHHVQEELKNGVTPVCAPTGLPTFPHKYKYVKGQRMCCHKLPFFSPHFPHLAQHFLYNGHLAFVEFQGLCPDLTLGEAKF